MFQLVLQFPLALVIAAENESTREEKAPLIDANDNRLSRTRTASFVDERNKKNRDRVTLSAIFGGADSSDGGRQAL